MSHRTLHERPTLGVLAGWQFAWTATPLSYLDPIFRGACLAARDLDCNVLLGCGMGSWVNPRDGLRPAWLGDDLGPAWPNDELRPAWPTVSAESDFVPIGPWNTDGLIVVNPLRSEARSRYVQDLRAAGHPVIFIASGEEGPAILADNRSGILEAMHHLVTHGHHGIAFIAGTPEDREGDSGERLQAYHDAVTMHSLAADSRLVAWGRHIFDGGYAAMNEILNADVPFSAVLASNDESALGAMQALWEAGRRIPQDVAIIGFDDRPESAVQKPPLSSVRIPLSRMGYRAVESLHPYLTGQTETIETRRVTTTLTPRASCGCDESTLHAAVSLGAASLNRPSDSSLDREDLVRAVATPVMIKAKTLSAENVTSLCRRLVNAFSASMADDDRAEFQDTLAAVLRETEASGEELHVWQAALSNLHRAFTAQPDVRSQPAMLDRALALLDQARIMISRSIQQQHRQDLVDQRWTLNHLGALAARLLVALDKTQVYDVLAEHLPMMGVQSMWIALFEPEGDDPIAQTELQAITTSKRAPLHFPSRMFPPADLLSADRAFSLALFPLIDPHGQLGFVAFDTAQLNLYGVITQELATALNSVQLYRAANEGRRLAEEANEMKSRFLSTVSHELRTPLNLIVGLSGMLLEERAERKTPLPESFLRDVEQIYTSAQLLSGLIGDVLDLASSDAGQLSLAYELIDLSDALQLVIETGSQLAYQKGLTWRADVPRSGPYVWGDRTRLRQVALNLINNAIKFTEQGQVRLKLETDTDEVMVSVSDTGLGIPAEEQEVIFDEFHRSERSVSQGYGGLGLGLSICKRLIDMHGGTMGVRSSGEEGAGSTFYFTLPTVQSSAVEAQRSAQPMLTPESVLILTHQTGGDQRLHDHLTERGFEVQTLTIHKTPDWFSQVATSPPGAIVIDMSTTAHQAWSVLKSLKSHPKTRNLPILFYSVSQAGGSVLEFDYLTKPIELTDLEQALDQQWLALDVDQEMTSVLIVDDDLNTLEMHTRIVQAHAPSHRVLKAQNGLEALNVLRHQPVDLVLLDLIMPKLDGFGVLEAMRQEQTLRDIPVIVLTGQVLSEGDMERLDRGVTTVLSKGIFSREETLEHVEAALERNRALSGEAQRLVRQAMAYIHQHYAEPISRADLAQHVALSEDYLTDCFRKELGVTPITYINRYRVNQAKILLTETYKSVTEIALDVGFSDSSYFSRVFRRETGMSPTDYRQA